MYDVDAIEAINFEQLATVTDRILLRARHGGLKRRSTTGPFPALARGSQPRIARGTQPLLTLDPYEKTYVPPRDEEDTVVTPPPVSRSHSFATTILLPTLLGIAVGLAAML